MPNVYDGNKPKKEIIKINSMKPGTVFIGNDKEYYMVSDESCCDYPDCIKCMHLRTGILHDMLKTDEREVFEGKLIMEC